MGLSLEGNLIIIQAKSVVIMAKRVLVIHGIFSDETHHYQTGRELEAQGYDVSYLTYDYTDPFSFIAVSRAINKGDYDIVVSHSLGGIHTWIAHRLGLINSDAKIITVGSPFISNDPDFVDIQGEDDPFQYLSADKDYYYQGGHGFTAEDVSQYFGSMSGGSVTNRPRYV